MLIRLPPLSPQNGGECLRAYVSVTLEQVAQWHDEQGHSGLWYVMQVVSQLLDPRTSEFTAAFVGRLVSTLISKAGRELGENLDQILRAILSKMQQAETLSVMQVRGGWVIETGSVLWSSRDTGCHVGALPTHGAEGWGGVSVWAWSPCSLTVLVEQSVKSFCVGSGALTREAHVLLLLDGRPPSLISCLGDWSP